MGFKEEMQSLFHIKGKMSENRLEQLIKEIYLPKMKTKFHSPYIYQGEVDWQRQSHLRRRRQEIPNENNVFGESERGKNEIVIGIESSFDESAASIVDSFGQIKAQKSFTLSDVNDQFNGGIDPEVAKEHHIEYLPKAIEEVMRNVGENEIKAIAFTIGPG